MKQQKEHSNLTEIVKMCIDGKAQLQKITDNRKICWAQDFQNIPCKYFDKTKLITVGFTNYVNCKYGN